MQHWISAGAQVRALARAVAAAFAASNLTTEEKNPGRIVHTELAWQAPPLVTDLVLSDASLQDYFDKPVNVRPDQLHAFWTTTLRQLYELPTQAMRRGVYAASGRQLPKLKVGQRMFRFSHPAGWPSSLDSNIGVMLSLEVAHTALISFPVDEVVSDDDNYLVRVGEHVFGVGDGRPVTPCGWDYDASGFVQVLLTMSRGEVNYDCQYDQIASLRSILHSHPESFPHNFEAIDQALQALRLLAFGSHCPELQQQVYVSPLDRAQLRADEQLLREAIDLAQADMSDRARLTALQALLVPALLSVTAFRRNIFSNPQFPYTLAPGRLQQIEDWLRLEYERRIPADMRTLSANHNQNEGVSP